MRVMDMFNSRTEPDVPRRRTSLTDGDYRDQAGFRCALRRFLRFSEDQARAHGITPRQHLLLLIVRGHQSYPQVNMTDLAESLQLRQPSVSLLVDRGVKRGLLIRTEDPLDRRRILVSLTEQGERILEDITYANRHELSALEDSLFRDSIRLASVRAEEGDA